GCSSARGGRKGGISSLAARAEAEINKQEPMTNDHVKTELQWPNLAATRRALPSWSLEIGNSLIIGPLSIGHSSRLPLSAPPSTAGFKEPLQRLREGLSSAEAERVHVGAPQGTIQLGQALGVGGGVGFPHG